MIVDPGQRRADIWNAGGAPTLLACKDGSVQPFTRPGTPLGGGETEWGHSVTSFGPGERLMLLSDGLLETRTRDGRRFGLRQLCALFGPQTHSSPGQLARSVRTATDEGAEDDRSLVLVSWPAEG